MNLGLNLGLSFHGGSAYNPVTALGNVVWWLRPDLGMTTNAGKVATWADQSGIGDANRNVIAPGTDKPAFNATDASYNNRPNVGTFNFSSGPNDCKLQTVGAWNATYTTFSLIIVGHANGAGTVRYFGSSQATDRLAIARSTAGNFVEYITAAGTEVGSTGVLATTPRLMIAEINGTTSTSCKMYADSTTVSTTMTAAGSLGAVAYTLGTYIGANLATTWGVDAIAEVMVINGLWSALSAAQKSGYAAYINARYNKAVT